MNAAGVCLVAARAANTYGDELDYVKKGEAFDRSGHNFFESAGIPAFFAIERDYETNPYGRLVLLSMNSQAR